MESVNGFEFWQISEIMRIDSSNIHNRNVIYIVIRSSSFLDLLEGFP